MADPQQNAEDEQPVVAPSEPASPTFPSSNPAAPTATGGNLPSIAQSGLIIGSKLGPYRLLEKLGEGGMGAVYKAVHEHLDKVVAVKVLPQHFTQQPDSIARFKREMKAVGKLNHPHIVQAFDAGEINGTHFLAMEYVEGSDLAQLVKERGRFSVVNACKAIRQAAIALSVAHAAGLIHRDIKPSNILVAKNGQIKLLDLGLALLADDSAGTTELTTAGQTFGTPDYMAPEQWENAHTADARTDLYALGCALFFLLVGRPPYGTDQYRTGASKMKGHIIDAAPDLATLVPDVPAALVAIYQKLLAKTPEKRFQTATELVQALAPFVSSKSAPVASVVAMPVTAPITPASIPSPATVSLASATPAPSALSDTATPKPLADPANTDRQATPTTSPISQIALPPRGGSRNWLLKAGLGGFAAVLLGVIIITITNKDGTQTKIEVPDTSKVEITTKVDEVPAKIGWHGWPADAPKPAIAPFDAEQAQHHQEAWAKYLGVPVEYTNSLGMKFRLIPPGEFLMGSSPEEIEEALVEHEAFLKAVGWDEKGWEKGVKSEAPQHKVIVAQPTYLGVYELTQSEHEKIMGKNPSGFAAAGERKDQVGGMDTTSHPAETISWNDAVDFCTKLSQEQRLRSFYFRAGETVTALDGTGYRLPTEAEWEFACRAGTTSKYWVGDAQEDVLRAGWFDPNSGRRTHPVGELKANPFGLYDVHGNVAEWVEDRWEPNYYGCFEGKAAVNPKGPFSSNSQNVVRGGSRGSSASFCRASSRNIYASSFSHYDIGFRLALPVDAVRQTLKLTGPVMPNRPKASVTDGSTSSTAKPLTPLPPLDLNETDPLPGWELPAGAPPPVVAPCEPTLATERQQLWAEFLKRPVIEELDIAALALSGKALAAGDSKATSAGEAPAASAVPLTKPSEKNANVSTLKFALIPPGEFRKIFTRPRDPAIEPDMPVRRFRLTKPYALSTTEVTWDQFRQFVEATGYQTEAETNGLGGRDREFKPDPNGKINWRTPGWKPAPNEPVTQVTPRDAEAFCAWLSRLGTPARPDGEKTDEDAKDKDKKNEDRTGKSAHPTYRLPTEAEWVHACRAGSVHKHVVGPEPGDLADYAWTKEFLDPNPQASPLHLVAQKKPNSFGLHDTLGNVWEYALDFMSPALVPYLPTSNPLGSRSAGVLGVGWDHPADHVHPAYCYAPYSEPTSNVGFRVLKQFDGEPLPGPLDRPLVLRAGQPLSVHALVPRPEKIPGLQSWSIELAGPHTAYTTAIAASSKGDVIATGSNITGKISLWNRDGNYQRALLGHEAGVFSLDFSRDGRWLASCDQVTGERGHGGSTARVWNVETGALHTVIPIPGWGNRIAFSPNGEQLAVTLQQGGSFLVIDLATGSIRIPANVIGGGGIAWSPDGTELACSHGDTHLRVWDAKTLQVLRDAEAPASLPLEWSPDGKWLALRNDGGKVAIRDAKTLKETETSFSNLGPSFSHVLAWLPDSKRLVVSPGDGGATCGVFDISTGEQLAKFDGGSHSVALSNEGKEAVVEYGGRLHFYDTSTGQKLREGRQSWNGGGATVLSPIGADIFLTWYQDVRVFDAATGAERRRLRNVLPEHGFNVLPAPDGSLLAAAYGGSPSALILDAQTGTKRHELLHAQGNVSCVAWSPDGKWLATGATDKLIRVWNVATGKIEHELAGHTGTIWSLAWSPDGTRLASAAEDKTVRLWNPLAGKLVATYDQFPEALNVNGGAGPLHQLGWTADSRRLWIALNVGIVPLDVETGTFGPLAVFTNGNFVTFLNTSPDGQRLLAREGYGWTFVRGRDAQDRRLLGQHLGQTAQWHPDSRRFLGWEPSYGTVGFDVETNRRLGLLFPWLTGDHWLCLGPTGHYRGSPGVEDQFVYVAMLEDGSQVTYSPQAFAEKFGWKNDPEKATLLGK